ncbi:hypothetical protein FCV25MIE_19848 [Fagus crenata]
MLIFLACTASVFLLYNIWKGRCRIQEARLGSSMFVVPWTLFPHVMFWAVSGERLDAATSLGIDSFLLFASSEGNHTVGRIEG